MTYTTCLLSRRGLGAVLGLILVASPVQPTAFGIDFNKVLANRIDITSPQNLFPGFLAEVSDYVVRSSGGPITLEVGAARGVTVSIDGQAPQGKFFNQNVNVSPGQSFTIVVSRPNQPDVTHYVRVLPQDFPAWT